MDKNYDSTDTFSELSEPEQFSLVEWCKQFEPIKTINFKHTSYGLKHQFKQFYVKNGQFKQAMIEAGFRCHDVNSQNWHFNISEKSVQRAYSANRKN